MTTTPVDQPTRHRPRPSEDPLDRKETVKLTPSKKIPWATMCLGGDGLDDSTPTSTTGSTDSEGLLRPDSAKRLMVVQALHCEWLWPDPQSRSWAPPPSSTPSLEPHAQRRLGPDADDANAPRVLLVKLCSACSAQKNRLRSSADDLDVLDGEHPGRLGLERRSFRMPATPRTQAQHPMASPRAPRGLAIPAVFSPPPKTKAQSGSGGSTRSPGRPLPVVSRLQPLDAGDRRRPREVLDGARGRRLTAVRDPAPMRLERERKTARRRSASPSRRDVEHPNASPSVVNIKQANRCFLCFSCTGRCG